MLPFALIIIGTVLIYQGHAVIGFLFLLAGCVAF